MVKGCIVAGVLPLKCFLFLLPNYNNILVGFFLFALVSNDPEVFLPNYSQTAVLHAAHFRRVVKYITHQCSPGCRHSGSSSRSDLPSHTELVPTNTNNPHVKHIKKYESLH